MTKILNLDEISTPEDKTIKLKGKTHAFKPLEVGAFIEQLKRIEALDVAKVKGSDSVEHSLEMITASFPTLTREILLTLNSDQLDAIGKFIRGELLTEAVEGAAATTGETTEDLKNE